ncbi:MAG: DUF975 family protein [Eubacterium sp.]|nr:DUF975 family protein [Eubacterium sp.]
MWTRKELKERGKVSFRRNYWKSVLIALIITFILGGSGGNAGGGAGSAFSNYINSEIADEESKEENSDGKDQEEAVSESGNNETASTDTEKSDTDSESYEFQVDSKTGEIQMEGFDDLTEKEVVAIGITFLVVFVIVFLAVFAVVIAMDVLIFNPLELGCRRFFFKNLDEPANLSNVVYGFDHNYKNVIKIMFFRDIYSFLWSLLFIIPGIIKSYEYRMIPYIVAENPDISKEDAFAMSKKLMDGQKWKTFVLDLSFIGWEFLSVFTCGILSVFYVDPYKAATSAALYEKLRYGNIEE